MKEAAVREETPAKLMAPSELVSEQLERVAGGARHKLDIKYGGPDGFYYGPAKS